MAAWPRVGGIAGVLFLTQRHTRRHFKRKVEQSHHHSVLRQVSPNRAKQLQTEITANQLVTFAQADVFARVVVEASQIQKRITEQYEPGRRTLRQEVTIDIEIPQSALRRIETPEADADAPGSHGPESSTFYFPVVVPPKGVLFDDLKVYSASDGELPTLAYREYAKVASSVLHLLLAAACFTRPDALPPGALECEVNAIQGIITRVDPRPRRDDTKARAIQRFRFRKGSATALHGVAGNPANGAAGAHTEAEMPDGQSLAKAIRGLSDVSDKDPRCAQALRLASNLIKVLTSHYAIVVEIPATASGRFTLKYALTMIPELDLETGPERRRRNRATGQSPRKRRPWRERIGRKLRAWRATLETLLGARPVSIKISLDNAWSCQSYHVVVRCSENLYISSQELSLPSPDYLSRLAKNAPTAPHIRFRRRLGQSYAHFYARYLSEPRTIKETDEHGAVKMRDGKPVSRKEKAPKLTLNFAEVPPGSLCRAALAAIAAAALVWIIGYCIAHLNGGALSTDVPVLILAFPGVAASWLGFDSSTPDLFQGPLTARLSLACTTVISLLATMLYIEPRITPGHGVATVHGFPAALSQLSVLGIADWRWSTLVIVATFNACYLSYRWFLNAWRFRYLGARPDPAGFGIKAYEDEDDALLDAAPSPAVPSSPVFSTVTSRISTDGS
jgi:hypothetical protein